MTNPNPDEPLAVPVRLRLDQHRWCVVRGYVDAVYGPVTTEDDARELAEHLEAVGVTESLEVRPFFEVTT